MSDQDSPAVSVETHYVQSNGIRMAIHKTGFGDPHLIPVIFLHGFPELGFSWRHQLAALASAGFGVAAPDLRGYGATGPQGEVGEYSMDNLARDVIGVFDALGVERAVVVGHDFGGRLAWTVARTYPDRVLGVISLNTPYSSRGERDTVEARRRSHGPTHYMTTFQETGVGEAMLSRDLHLTFASLMCRPSLTLAEFGRLPDRLQALPATLFTGEPAVMGEPFLNQDELDVYVEAFKSSGFEGALNWYRNLRQDWVDREREADLIPAPTLMISAANDYFLPPDTTIGMEQYVPDLEKHVIAACGHWTQQERPAEVNALILDWLRRRIVPIWDGALSN